MASTTSSTDHDVLLGRVLPHVQTGVINEAQRTILESTSFDWDDGENDSDNDDEYDPRDFLASRSMTTASRQSHTNSTSDFGSYAGRSGGLSPPRRLAVFADFDGVQDSPGHHQMAESKEKEASQSAIINNKHHTTTFTSQHMPLDLDQQQPSPSAHGGVAAMSNGNGGGETTHHFKADTRVSRSIVSSASSLRHQRRLSGAYSPIEPPPRSSSSRLDKSTTDTTMTSAPSTTGGVITDKPLPPLKAGAASAPQLQQPPRSRGHLVLRGDGDDEDQDDDDENDLDLDVKNGEIIFQHRKNSNQQYGGPQRPATSYNNGRSSTPPPIANVRPTRMVVYDDFEDDDPLRGFEDLGPAANESPMHTRAAVTELVPSGPLFEDVVNGNSPRHQKQQPPVAMKTNKEMRRLDSLASNSDRRGNREQQHHGNGGGGGGGGQGAMHSRMVPLAANYRDLRTPVLDHVQLYHDAESKKPLFDPNTEGRAAQQRSANPKPRRVVDDSGTALIYHNGGGGHYHHSHTPGGGTMNSASANSNNNLMPPHIQQLPLRRAYSDDEVSVRHSISGKTVNSLGSQNTNSAAAANMPDFFTSNIFQVVLHNPTTAHRLLKFSESRLCAENVEFLSRVDAYRTTLNGLAGQMSTIHKTYISPGSPSQINVNGALLKRAHRDMRALVTTALPSMENLFTDLQEQIETLVFQDVYPRFVRHQMALSASRALGSDRFKYQGLGDCFCLTNPNVADNPIVFASDGFVKVTGYTRPEIVPRNCRFLQGAHTDRQAVARLRNAIHEQKESVELLLNYKKNGDPFWNLLYVVPLFNARGKCEFFLGGQVNCSTTIHSNVDVMRVLSLSDKDDVEEPENQRNGSSHQHNKPIINQRPSARRTFLKALGVRHDHSNIPPMPTGDTGMENSILGRMEGQDLTAQMKEFYTAYSKFLIVRFQTWTIEFHSDGVIDALNPANMSHTMVCGSDVFRFLGLHMLSKQSDYKTRVRNSLRAGQPVSTALRLQTKRSAVFRGDEAFVAHWTPLKDEKAMVHWIVITLAPMSY